MADVPRPVISAGFERQVVTLCLTYDWSEDHDAYLAVISDGSPQRGDENVEVLDVELCSSVAGAKEWFERAKIMKPWETRQ